MVALELIILAVLSFCGSVVVAYAIWRSNRSQVKQQKELVNRQVWIGSARLILKLWEKLDDDFVDANAIIFNHQSFEESEERMELRVRYLNHLASVTALYYDGILTEQHIAGYFGGVLNDLGAHKETVDYLWDPKRQSHYWTVRKWLKEKTGHRLPN